MLKDRSRIFYSADHVFELEAKACLSSRDRCTQPLGLMLTSVLISDHSSLSLAIILLHHKSQITWARVVSGNFSFIIAQLFQQVTMTVGTIESFLGSGANHKKSVLTPVSRTVILVAELFLVAASSACSYTNFAVICLLLLRIMGGVFIGTLGL